MKGLLQDNIKVLEMARDPLLKKVLIRCILKNRKLRSVINSMLREKQTPTIDADHILNDTILIFLKAAIRKDFHIESTPLAYLMGIAKNVWLMDLRKNKNTTLNTEKLDLYHSQPVNVIQFDKEKIIENLLSKIGEDCKTVLLLWAHKFKMTEIAEKLNYQSEGYARKKKMVCLKKLIAHVDSHPQFKEELKEYVRGY
jgi:DNA-directed RNA polymerase specialized sigma24 family protein